MEASMSFSATDLIDNQTFGSPTLLSGANSKIRVRLQNRGNATWFSGQGITPTGIYSLTHIYHSFITIPGAYNYREV